MEYEHITCVLEFGAIVCYGFLILALAFYWPNEANAHLLLFCMSNGILALVSTLKTKGTSELCQWNGLLTLLALTLGFDSLYRSQIERKRMAEHQFRLYRKRPMIKRLAKSCILAILASLIAWNLYQDNPTFKMCFLKASESAKLEETMISFFWILFFYLRPVAMTVKESPAIIVYCHRQIQILKHERELEINGKLLLYKDHHRRLFHVIMTTVNQVLLCSWIALTFPYIIQIISLVAGLNGAMKLDQLSPLTAFIYVNMYRALPLANCFLFISAYVIYFSMKMKG